MMKRIITATVAILIVVCLAVSAFAGGSLTYKQKDDQFIIDTKAEGKEYYEAPIDFFENFKNIMPGMKYTDTITVKNDASNSNSVKVYMRSKGTEDREFLKYLTLRVSSESGDEYFNAPPNETSTLSDWVYLGSIEPGGDVTLDLELTVSGDMGNDCAYSFATLTWEFKVEGIGANPDPSPTPGPDDPTPTPSPTPGPDDPTPTPSPTPGPDDPTPTPTPDDQDEDVLKTGDYAEIGLYGAMLLMSGIMIVPLVKRRKKD